VIRAAWAAPVRLAHLAGVPSPYFAPLFRAIARDPRVDFTVIYCSSEGVRAVDGSRYGYQEQFVWDIDLLSGYRSVFLRRADRTPGLGNHTWSVRNWDVVPALLRGRFDVLSTAGYNSLTYLLGALTQRVLGRHVLFREEQTLLDRRSAANVIAKQLLLRALFSQGRGLYISRENQRWFRHFGMPDDRLFPTPYSVDNAALRSEAARLAGAKPRLRDEFGIAEDGGPMLVSVGRLIEKKQPQFLLEAFRRARQRVRATLLFVGSGPLEESLRRQVLAQRIPDVVFAGFLNRSEIARAFAAADAFALLSRERETFGLVVNEAMNFELPVIVSDRVGCASDLVSTGYNGFVVSAHDPGDAAAAIEQLVDDPALRARMGAASLERISEWTVERTAEGFIAAALEASPRSTAC
jgi:glycosyltransferase involved in cell wall biosynthesis